MSASIAAALFNGAPSTMGGGLSMDGWTAAGLSDAVATFLLDTQLGLVVSVLVALWATFVVAAVCYADSDDVKDHLTSIRAFVSYDARERGEGVVAVDCTHCALPTLTHHKESTTPRGLRGDTSTDTVFNALHAGWAPLRKARAVTCNHFDIDGVCSVWSLMHPAKALRHEELLREAALIGDMRELRIDPRTGAPDGPLSSAALKLCCWMNAVERERFTRPFEVGP